MKIDAPGALLRSSVTLLAPRWPKMRFGAHLGLHLDGYWGASWRQDGPRWRQVGQLGAKMCPRWPTWRPRWPTWRTFGSILVTFFGSWARSCPKWRKPKKTIIVQHFSRFFGVLGLFLEAHLGGMLGSVAPSGRHLGATWRQDGAQERQDKLR